MNITTTALVLRDIDLLFKPFRHRKLPLSTRLVMTPLTRWVAQNGVPTAETLHFYRRRAEHMLGLIITEPVAIEDEAAAADSGMAHFYGGSALRVWKRICRAVHATSCKIAPQLNHVGMLRPAKGDMPHPESPPIGPSGIDPITHKRRGEAMSRERIHAVAGAFGKAAGISRMLGFDAVEINGGRGCLIDQYLRKETNHRSDEYGGDIERRARFACEVLHEVKKRAGRRMPIIFRLSQYGAGEQGEPLASTADELSTLVQLLCAAGVDMFACDADMNSPAFQGSRLSLAGWIRELSQRPVITGGGVGLPGCDLRALAQQLAMRDVELVGVGRALLADAEWGRKVRQAQEDEILPYSHRSWLHLY